MTHDVANPEVTDLSPSQLRALEALLGGSSVTKAGEAAGVSRESVHRWLREPAFAEALEGAKAEMWGAAKARLVGLADKAGDAVEKAIDDGNARVALSLLRGLGLLPSHRAIVDRTPRWDDESGSFDPHAGPPF
jgi:hypothetical protein